MYLAFGKMISQRMFHFAFSRLIPAVALIASFWPLFFNQKTSNSQEFLSQEGPEWGFVLSWDDKGNFQDNPIFNKTLPWVEWFQHVCFSSKVNVYEPVAWIFKYLVFFSSGHQMDAWVFRLWSLVIHTVNALVLLPRVILKTLSLFTIPGVFSPKAVNEKGKPVTPVDAIALDEKENNLKIQYELATYVSCTLFLVHPVNIEVIGWPSAQSYTLAGFFCLLSTENFLDYLKFDTPDRNLLGRSVLFYAAAVLSKGAALLMPFVFVCIAWVLCCKWKGWTLVHMFKLEYSVSNILTPLVARVSLCYSCVGFCLLGVAVLSNTSGMDRYCDTIALTFLQRIIKAPIMLIMVFSQFCFPVFLRPHYRVQTEDIVLTNPLAVFSITLVTSMLLSLSRNEVAFGTFAAFLSLLFPAFGIVQHGMITLSADRYCYLPGMVLLPWLTFLAHNFLCRSAAISGGADRLSFGRTLSKRNASQLNSNRYNYSYRAVACILLVLSCLTFISSKQMVIWKGDESMYQYSIKVDQSDWRMLDSYAEFLVLDGRKAESVKYWKLSQLFSPPAHHGIKTYLQHAKLHVMLGDTSAACKMYEELYIQLKQENRINGMVSNNMAICRLGASIHKYREHALEMFQEALEARELPKHRKQIVRSNLNALKGYDSSKGPEEMRLMW